MTGSTQGIRLRISPPHHGHEEEAPDSPTCVIIERVIRAEQIKGHRRRLVQIDGNAAVAGIAVGRLIGDHARQHLNGRLSAVRDNLQPRGHLARLVLDSWPCVDVSAGTDRHGVEVGQAMAATFGLNAHLHLPHLIDIPYAVRPGNRGVL